MANSNQVSKQNTKPTIPKVSVDTAAFSDDDEKLETGSSKNVKSSKKKKEKEPSEMKTFVRIPY